MTSLARCLDIFRDSIAPEEAHVLKKIARSYRAEGFSTREADENVLRDVIGDLESDLHSILKQAGASEEVPAQKVAAAVPPPAPVPVEQPAPAPAVEKKAEAVETSVPEVKEVAPVPTPVAEVTEKPAAVQGTSWSPATNGTKLPKPIGVKMPPGNLQLNPGEAAPMLPRPAALPLAPKPTALPMPKVPAPAAPNPVANVSPQPAQKPQVTVQPKPLPAPKTTGPTLPTQTAVAPKAAPVTPAPVTPIAPKPSTPPPAKMASTRGLLHAAQMLQVLG